MILGLLADTHIPEVGPDLPPQVYAALEGCDRILHCGDLHTLDVLDRLERLAPVLAARGNGDAVRPLDGRPGVPDDHRVADSLVVELAGYRIGLTHDLEAVEGRDDDAAGAILDERFGGRVDIALCGHTHVPMAWGLAGGTCVINPGSPTLPYGYTHLLGTVGLLELGEGRYDLRILNVGSGAVEVHHSGPGASPCIRGPRPDWR